ncbi:hypothetical protein KKG58_02065 [Patescibacteria group bacterium]|nr:hypothetical protein [Patescibacteria group bacterium]
MFKKRLSKSVRKYIRLEKARLQREISDFKEKKKQIKELYKKVCPKKE